MRRAVRWPVLGVALMALALLGEGAPMASAAPAAAQGGAPEATDWVQFSAGFDSACGVRATGRLYCWGHDNRQQLGNGPGNANSPAPVEVAGGATDWRSVSVGGDHACAVKTTGTLWCWGGDDEGQQGNGPVVGDIAQPAQIGSAADWKSVSAGLGFLTCGRRANKRIYCWGSDNDGGVGNGTPFADANVPTAVGANADWTSVSAGGQHACGRRSNGRVYCWGRDVDGQVGDGGAVPGAGQPSPRLVAGGFADWANVSAGITHNCGRRANRRVYCWGSDLDAGLGNGAATNNTGVSSPVQLSGNATDWRAVDAGTNSGCARKASGRLYCWGYDAYGQVGDGNGNGSDNNSPTQVAGATTDWKKIDAGNLFTCGLRTTGRLYCWGYGFWGQRGDGQSGSGTAQPTPVEVL